MEKGTIKVIETQNPASELPQDLGIRELENPLKMIMPFIVQCRVITNQSERQPA